MEKIISVKNLNGRNKNKKFIVTNHEILSEEEITQEDWRIITLLKEFATIESTLIWCAKRRLIPNSVACLRCRTLCGLSYSNQLSDTYGWKCNDCVFFKSIRDISKFSEARIDIGTIILIIYFWAAKISKKW